VFTGLPAWFFAILFGFWRLSYNIGLGYLLHHQSKTQALVKVLSEYLREGSSSRAFIKAQLVRKMGRDYDFEVPFFFFSFFLIPGCS